MAMDATERSAAHARIDALYEARAAERRWESAWVRALRARAEGDRRVYELERGIAERWARRGTEALQRYERLALGEQG